jgi:UDP-arabinose 4-epimerase
MNILVTGGAGYIGSHAAKALALAGHTPVVLDNLSRGHRGNVKWGPLVESDIGDEAAVARALAVHRIEAVLHFAAYAYVGESMEQPRLYFSNNVAGTLGLLNAMRTSGVNRIVFSSTCATYGAPQHVPIAEDHPQAPVNPYGESKLFVEKMLRWLGETEGLRWVALRYFNAAGTDPDGELGEKHDPETHLIPLAILAALGRGSLQVFGSDYPTLDGTAVRDYIHVTDLADAHVRALDYLQNGGASLAMNLGVGEGRSVRQVIDAVAECAGGAVPHTIGPRRAGDPAELVADASLARRVMKWRPSHSDLSTIVQTAWRWFQS